MRSADLPVGCRVGLPAHALLLIVRTPQDSTSRDFTPAADSLRIGSKTQSSRMIWR